MLFFPYGVDLNFPRFPILTIVVSIICIIVYVMQGNSFHKSVESAQMFCEKNHERLFMSSVEKITGDKSSENCAQVLLAMHFNTDKDKIIAEMSKDIKPFSMLTKEQTKNRVKTALTDKYASYAQYAPVGLTS